MKTNQNDRAFPTNAQAGMTKREYFAAMALQGLLANSSEEDMTAGRCVQLAVLMVDGLIEELNK